MSDPTVVAAVEAPAAIVDASVPGPAETTTKPEGDEANGEAAAIATAAGETNGDAKEEGGLGGEAVSAGGGVGKKGGRPRKDKAAAAPAAEPSRRSTRISAQPAKPKEEESTSAGGAGAGAGAGGAGRKRSASGTAGAKKNGKRAADEVVEGEGKEEGSNKKV
ncbi:hypothetical protein K435DRAFT_211315, partial [Dendrothele bispora CBS 962.96]